MPQAERAQAKDDHERNRSGERTGRSLNQMTAVPGAEAAVIAPLPEESRAILRDHSATHSANTSVRAEAVKAVQQRQGNRYVQRLLQPRLTVGEPDDAYEYEADRVADQVLAMSQPERPAQRLDEEDGLRAQPVAAEITPLAQRQAEGDEPESMPIPEFRLPTPSLLEPTEAAEPGTLLDPGISAALRLIERQLNPASVRSALLQIDPGTLTLSPPAVAGIATGGGPETAEEPVVPAGAGPKTPREAGGSDVMKAILAVPAVNALIGKVGALALDKVTRDVGRLGEGEAGLVGFTTGVIGIQALGQVLSQPEARRKALDLLSGRTFPVPGFDALQFELSSRGDEWTFGLHLDAGALLPAELGFGPSSPSAFGPPSRPTGGAPSAVQRQGRESEEGDVDSPKSEWAVNADLEARIDALRRGGQPLPESERHFFEPRFGVDFRGVRIHTDARAAETAEDLDAQAYTVGQDIVFNEGRYAPETEEGRRLLAHELTHVIQQNGTSSAESSTVARQASGLPARKGEDKYARIAERLDTLLRSPHPILNEIKIASILAGLTRPEVTKVERAYGQPDEARGEWNPYKLREDVAARLPNGVQIARWIEEHSELKPKATEAEAKKALEREIKEKAAGLWPDNERKETLRKLQNPAEWPKRVSGRQGDIVLDDRTSQQIAIWGPWVVNHFDFLYGERVVTEELAGLLRRPGGDLALIWAVRSQIWNRWVQLNKQTAVATLIGPAATSQEKRARFEVARKYVPEMEAFRSKWFDKTPGALSDYMKVMINARIATLKSWLVRYRPAEGE